MSKLRFAVVVIAVGLSSTAFAQRLTADQRAACRPDFKKFCGDIKPGGGGIMECLNGKHDQLSDDCKKVVDSRKEQ
jgi:Cysteine rich repeat